MSKVSEYVKSSADELKNKVSWPTWEELQGSTGLVMVASLIFAAVIMVVDFVGSEILSLIYSLTQ
ncbi:MAG: preprotein translocase subunit SecE [Flavobacteriaceae bacterium]|nr:preprotein translocase subunit SecE [Flavobacteriaceae bacterium]